MKLPGHDSIHSSPAAGPMRGFKLPTLCCFPGRFQFILCVVLRTNAMSKFTIYPIRDSSWGSPGAAVHGNCRYAFLK